jgi:hypothetical protein
MTFTDPSKYFSPELMQRAFRDEDVYGWRPEDAPEVIEAARKASLRISGGMLLVFLPTEIGGGTCSPRGQGIQLFTSISTELPWDEQVNKSADSALSEFKTLREKRDFVAEGRKAAGEVLKELGRPDTDIANMLGFEWHFRDSPFPVVAPREKTVEEKIIEQAQEKFRKYGDIEGARTLVRPLAEKGNPFAQMAMADTYHKFGDTEANFEEMNKWYRKAADQGHAQAWYHLHMQYDWGRIGGKPDKKEAANCLRKAAEQGHVMACSFLGSWYRTGIGVTLDYLEAFKWLQKAASFGRPESQGELGEMYRRGSGIPRDYVEAYFWLSLAVRSPWNCVYLPRRFDAAKHLTPDQMESVKKRLAEWKPTPLPREANAPYFVQ